VLLPCFLKAQDAMQAGNTPAYHSPDSILSKEIRRWSAGEWVLTVLKNLSCSWLKWNAGE